MESLSLVTDEAKKKVASLLGKNSSSLFVCFCRMLYANKDGKWKDDNLMGFLSVVVTRGIVKKFPIYSILLFDYNSFNLQLCVELYDHMKEPIKSSELCYIIPHHDLSFCLLFTNEDDAFIFNTGMRGVCQSLQRDSRPVIALSPSIPKKRKSWFSFLKRDKQEKPSEHSYHISNVITVARGKDEGLMNNDTSVLERLNDMSALSRFSYSSEKRLVDFSLSGDTREMIGSNKREEERRKAEEERRKAEEERRRAEEEERRRTEEEERRRTEEEERRRTEEEERRRTEEEERRRTEEEARRRTEEEARRRIEEEARRRTEEEARRRTEEEARRRTEEEARRRTEEEARRRTEEEARRRKEEEERRREEHLGIEETKPKRIIQQDRQGLSKDRPSSQSPPPPIPPPIVGHVRRKRHSLAPPLPVAPNSPKSNLRDSIKFDAIPEFTIDAPVMDPRSRASFPLPDSFAVPSTSRRTRLSLPSNVRNLPPPPPPPPALPGRNRPHSPPSSRVSFPLPNKAAPPPPSSRISFPVPKRVTPPSSRESFPVHNPSGVSPPSSRESFPVHNPSGVSPPSSRKSFPVNDPSGVSPPSSKESSPVLKAVNPLSPAKESYPIPIIEQVDINPSPAQESYPVPIIEQVDINPSPAQESYPVPIIEPMDFNPSPAQESYPVPIIEPMDFNPSPAQESYPVPILEPVDFHLSPAQESYPVPIQLENLEPVTFSTTPLSEYTSSVTSSSQTPIIPSGVRAIKKKESKGSSSTASMIPRPCVSRSRSSRKVVTSEIPKEEDVDDSIMDSELVKSSSITPTLAIPKIVFHRNE